MTEQKGPLSETGDIISVRAEKGSLMVYLALY
jgi:hypothetical protein